MPDRLAVGPEVWAFVRGLSAAIDGSRNNGRAGHATLLIHSAILAGTGLHPRSSFAPPFFAILMTVPLAGAGALGRVDGGSEKRGGRATSFQQVRVGKTPPSAQHCTSYHRDDKKNDGARDGS